MNGRTIATSLRIAVLVGIALIAGVTPLLAQTMADYTSEPPFLTEAVAPNILLLMDNSGSMNWSAYHRSGEAYDPAKTYYGYFSSSSCYSYGSSKFTPGVARAASAPTCSGSYPWDGNFLNYMTMARIEIVKWVMMGGKCAPRSIMGECYPGGKLSLDSDPLFTGIVMDATGVTAVTGNRCINRDSTSLYIYTGTTCSGSKTTYSLDSEIAAEPMGVIQQVGDKARFGLMEFATTTGGNGGKILAEVGGNLTSMVNAIENTKASGGTPLAESLYEATRYFAQIKPAYAVSDYNYTTKDKDPYYYKSPWASTPQFVKCCKSFVMVFTDGQPTYDTNIPSALQDYAHSAASHAPTGFTGHCTSAAGCTVDHASSPHSGHGGGLTNHNSQSDHHDNCSAYYGGVSNDTCNSNGSHYLDDVAYFAHTTDLRQPTIPVIAEAGNSNVLDGVQNLIVYTFYAFGTGSNLLKDTAKMGGFEDRNNSLTFDTGDVWDQYNNYTGALGADGVPDTYFESSNADDMRDRFVAAINSIMRRSQSGTSISVLATSGTGEGALYQSYFYPSTQEASTNADVRWTGFTQGLWVDKFGNVREDTDGDHRLVLSHDHIIKTIIDPGTNDVGLQRFVDANADGKADTPSSPVATIPLKEGIGIWEAGKQLAKLDHANRRILTWVDLNNDGVVDAGHDAGGQADGTHGSSGEVIPFTTANATPLKEYLRADADTPTSNPFKSIDIIQFIRGCYDTAAAGPCPKSSVQRDRRMTVPGLGLVVWKFGDPVHSTPTIVSQPRESYDFIYGDAGYLNFFKRWKDRRHVAYVGANDGMLHAFNGGFYHRGDDTSTAEIEHGWFSNTPTTDGRGKELGDELWGFIPYQLLPHLRWLAQADYTHVYYVDLKPKVTDVRIFTPEPACAGSPTATGCIHPNGWGTILIGGFRMGGSCGNCSTGGASPMTATIGGSSRTFYTAYFVLDITDPDAEPKLLWSFSDAGMGLSTSYPAVVRMNPPGQKTCPLTGTCDDVWIAVFGSGPTGYDGRIGQTGKLYAVDLKTGPKSGTGASAMNIFSTFPVKGSGGDLNTFMGDLVSLDRDLDFRTDTLYGGSVIDDGSLPWRGRMYRLTVGGCLASPCSSSTWGYNLGGTRIPTEVLDDFSPYPSGSSVQAGPMLAAPALAVDDSNNVWVFFGTGRFLSNVDKTNTEQQRLYGVKDMVLAGYSGICTEAGISNCKTTNLVNVSDVSICVICSGSTTQVTSSALSGVTKLEGDDPATTLQGLVQSKGGWVTNLPTTGERSLVTPTILGGIVFFPTYVPKDDICTAAGDGYLYGLFYQTGSAFSEPVLGTTSAGANAMANASVSLGSGVGMLSQMAIHIGAQGSGAGGATAGGTGCASGITGIMQSSTGLTNTICTNPGSVASRFVAWINQRE